MREDWEIKKLRQVCELVNGRAYSKPELLNSGKYRVLRVGNFFTNDHWYYSDLELEEKKYCDTGDLLYAWSASFGPRIWTGGKVIYHYHIWKVLHDRSQIDQKFLFYFFQWDTEKVKEDQGTGTTMLHVSMGSMNEREIPVPPVPEQQRIVALLDEAFEGLATAKANAEQNLRNARALFESHLESIFSAQGNEWVDKAFEELIESNIIGLTKNSREQGDDKEWPYVKMNNITRDNRFDFSRHTCVDATAEEVSKFALKEGDFLFNTRNSHELVGKSCIYESNSKNPALYNNNIMRVRFQPGIDPRFILLAFSSKGITNHLNALKSGTTNVSAIYFKDLKSLLIPVPPFAEQQRIANDLESLRAETNHLTHLYERKLASLEELKKALLHQAFHGEL